MRTIFWRELRELTLLWVPLVIAAVFAAAEMPGISDKTEDILAVALLGGCAVGAVQGVLDRLRRNDDFLRHRPLSTFRLDLARTVAGLLACAIPAAVFLALFPVFTGIERRQWRGFGTAPEFWSMGPARGVLFLCAPLASWAVLRFAVGTRHLGAALVLLVALPWGAWGLLSRAPSVPAATATVLGVAALLTAVRLLPRGRVAAVLAVAGFLGLEGLLYLRTFSTDLLLGAYPNAALDDGGETVFFRDAYDREDAMQATRTYYDAERNVLRETSGLSAHPVVSRLRLGHGTRVWDRFEHPAFLGRFYRPGPPWAWQVLSMLRSWKRDELQWRYENGRFLRTEPRGTVRAGIGPDGYRTGPDAARGPRFDDDSQVLFCRQEGGEARSLAFVSADARRLTVFEFEGDDLRVSERGFAEYGEGTATILGMAHDVVLLAFPRALGVVDEEGALRGRAPWDPGEEEFTGLLRGRPGPWMAGVATDLGPVHPRGGRVRLRLFRDGSPPVVADVAMEPESFGERFLASWTGLFAAVRPLPLNVAAWFSDAPRTWRETNLWWWRDPWFAGRAEAGWLVASLAIALLCAWTARRRARVRCATLREVRLWTGACLLLGPLGVVWMRLTLPDVPVERVGGGRRAVNLDRCPETDAPWPEPEPSGVEVILR